MNGFVSAQALKPKQRSDLSVLGTGRQHATSVRTFGWCATSFAPWWAHSSDFLSFPGWRWLSFLLFLNKGNNQNITSSWLSKFLASSLLYRWSSSPDNTWVGCQSKAIIIISADGQNGRVICNIMNAPIPNFSWSFDIFCGWSSSSCKLHLHNLLWKILVKTLLPRRLHAAECLKRHLRAEWLRKLSTLEMLPLSHDIRHFSDNRKRRDGIT